MKKALVLKSLCVGVLITACSTSQDNKENPEKFSVTSPILIDTVSGTDYVADIHSINNVEIRARVKGYIEKIYVDEGKPVKKGQILFTITSQEYKGELLKARAILKSAIAEAKAGELDLHNIQLLVDKSVVSTTELEMAQSKLDALKAKIEEAESQEVNAALKLSFTEIRAPFDGVIDRIPNKIGSLIDEGTWLTTISDNSQVFAYFNVSEREYLDFSAEAKQSSRNKEVSLFLANSKEHSHKGIVETIEGEFDNVTGSIAFRARFPNPERILKHGSSGKVRVLKRIENALVIPQKATFEVQDKIYVYIVDAENKIEVRNIVTKMRLPHLYVLESGLTEKDRIIYEGIQSVKQGMEITAEWVPMKNIIVQLARR